MGSSVGRAPAVRAGGREFDSFPIRHRFLWKQPQGEKTCPYLYRWVIDFGRFGSIRLHHWIRSDDKRAKHDHPSDFLTLVLKGTYTDLAVDRNEEMRPGSIRRRSAEHIHTVDVHPGGCWTLLYFWPQRRLWGFWASIKGRPMRWYRSARWFDLAGHHPCDQP